MHCMSAFSSAGVHHVIFSTLPDTRSAEFAEFYKTVPAIPDHPADYRVPHFDNKVSAEA